MHGLTYAALKVLVIELHLDDSLIDGTHALTTSAHASFAILSNTGLIAGLI